jgi:hypothetical protein
MSSARRNIELIDASGDVTRVRVGGEIISITKQWSASTARAIGHSFTTIAEVARPLQALLDAV